MDLIPTSPSKLFASDVALWEIQLLQDYVSSLVAHDLANNTGVFAAAAFDLFHTDPVHALVAVSYQPLLAHDTVLALVSRFPPVKNYQ